MTNTLRVERAIKHMTQQQLAEAIGVSRQTISKGVPGSTCWWWIDMEDIGNVTEAGPNGEWPWDTFYCKNSDYPEK